MNKLKKITLSAKSENTVSDMSKGSIENPYTMEERNNFGEESWPGGYVEGLGYLPPASFDGFDSSNESSGSDQGAIILDGAFSSLSQYTQNELRNLSGFSGTIYVTSTTRTPMHQAEIMLSNIKTTGVEAQLRLYAEPGKQVIRVYNASNSDQVNIENMTTKINEVGPYNVSHHCGDPNVINVFDVSKTHLGNKVTKFITAVSRVAEKVLDEPQNNCVHVEIKQPQ
jgi:hypothetical protein